MLKNRLWEREGKEPYLGVVHRLDQPVEGLLVFAKTKKAAASLSAQVQDGRMVKQYLAVTLLKKRRFRFRGRLETGCCRTGIQQFPDCAKGNQRGQEGCAGVPDPENLERARGVRKKAGRLWRRSVFLPAGHHQIRVQMAGAGCRWRETGNTVPGISAKEIFRAL